MCHTSCTIDDYQAMSRFAGENDAAHFLEGGVLQLDICNQDMALDHASICLAITLCKTGLFQLFD